LSITGFTLPEIDLAIQKLSEEPVEDIEDASSVTGVPVCQVNDLWELGDHRVHCGDARSESAFDKLMQGELGDVVIIDPCVYRKLKLGRSGGEVRQGWRVI
jgi:hypothetical protein